MPPQWTTGIQKEFISSAVYESAAGFLNKARDFRFPKL